MVKLLSNNQGGMRKIKRWLAYAKKEAVLYVQRMDTRWKGLLFIAFGAIYKVKVLRPVTQPPSRWAYNHHRITAGLMCLLITAGVALPVVNDYYREQRYQLNSQAQSLLGGVNPNLAKKLTYDAKEQLYQFNKDAKKTTPTAGNPLEKLKSQIGGGGKQDKQLYSVDAPKDLSKGVTYYDNQMDLSFKVTPLLEAMPGEKRSGHLIYPLKGVNGQVAYTSEATGMKENIILYESPGDTFVTDYKLDLPKSLEARLLDSGDLGIYSADPALFGQISYGSSDDQARVEQARNNSEKTYLAFVIPAPVVMGLGQTNQASIANIKSSFSLKDNILTVTTSGLDKAEYPLSIDPSVSVSSSSDFQTGNQEDANSTVDNGELRRSELSGGSVGSWTSATGFTTGRNEHTSIAYNGYLYVIGGSSGSTTVQYAAIASDGTIGTWTPTTGIGTARSSHTSVAYNGYLYIIGGWTGSTRLNTIQYAQIASNGSVGAWSSPTTFTTARSEHTSVAYNGYLYILGGTSNGTTGLNDVQYAPINANGSLGSWSSANTFTTGRWGHTSVAYNGYLYVIGGTTGTRLNDVQYAPINANGSLGSWLTTTSFSTARWGHTSVAYNGHLYVIGGNTDSNDNSVQYVPIYANGKIGNWLTTTSFSTARSGHTSVAYNGQLYVIGGPDNSVERAQVESSGSISAFTPSTFTTARYGHATVAYQGYLYIIGGHTGNALLASIEYAQITSTGALGTWNSATNLPSARWLASAVAYNGYLYVVGGNTNAYSNEVRYTTINSSTGALGGTWSTGTNLPSARFYHTTAAANGYLYVIGGETSTGTINEVRYATLNASTGAVGGTWNSATLPTARKQHASVVSGGYLYVIGGVDSSSNILGEVRYASLNTSTGALGAWNTANSLSTVVATGLYSHSAAVYNGFIYLAGGRDANFARNLVLAASINGDGSLGTWKTLNTFTGARVNLGLAAANGYLYVIGGDLGGPSTNDIQYAQINNSGGNGSTGTWTPLSSSLNVSNAISNTVSAVYNGYIYIIGGNQGAFTNQIRYAPFTKTGEIGTWASTATDGSNNNIPTVGSTVGVTDHNATIYKGYMYVLGGWDGTNNRTQTFYAPVNSNGTIGTWSSGTALPGGGRTSGAAFGYNGYLYLVGGSGNTSTIYTQIQANGSLGSWLTTSSFGTSRSDIALSLNNGYVYIAGGWTGSTQVPDVEYAKINSNGTLDPWVKTTYLPQARSGHRMAISNGYAYINGGVSPGSSSAVDTTLYAAIQANGSLGEWQKAFTNFTNGREQHEMQIYNGYMYIFAGYSPVVNIKRQDVQSAPLSVVARKASYSKTIDLGTESAISNISYTGSLANGIESVNYKTAGSDGVFGASKSATVVGCANGAVGRYVQFFVVLNNEESAVFPDTSAASVSELESLVVDYDPAGVPPERRLRHGAWFLNEQLQSFQVKEASCT